MKRQKNIYLIQYNLNWVLIQISGKNPEIKSLIINENNFLSFVNNLLLKIKNKYITIFVPDLKHIYIQMNNEKYIKDFTIKPYIYNKQYYLIKITNILNPNKALVLKDFYHFIRQSNIEDSLEFKASNLYQLHREMLLNFKININYMRFLSLTSISNKIFTLLSKEKKTLIKRLNCKEDTFIRKGYYGGRNEIYEPIGSDLYYYDINSLYPFIMKEFKLPIGVPVFKNAAYFKNNDINNFFGFIDVLIKTTKDKLPILPYRPSNKYEKMGILYPEGTLRAVYFSEELKYALENGYKIERIFGAYTFDSEILFDNFINKLYFLRNNANNSFMKKIYKNIMNNLYGYYGAIFVKEITTLDGDDLIGIKNRYYSVAISAAITAYARIYMYKFNLHQNSNLVYWDTDGIFVKKPLNESLIGKELGKFRFIHFINEVIFLAPKVYMYRYEINSYQFTFKGIKIKDYFLEGSQILPVTKEKLIKNLKENTLDYTYVMHLKNIIENKIQVLSFTVYNKRACIKKGSKIITRPWIIHIYK